MHPSDACLERHLDFRHLRRELFQHVLHSVKDLCGGEEMRNVNSCLRGGDCFRLIHLPVFQVNSCLRGGDIKPPQPSESASSSATERRTEMMFDE